MVSDKIVHVCHASSTSTGENLEAGASPNTHSYCLGIA